MIWMWIWMSHYHVTAAYVGQVLGRLSMDHLRSKAVKELWSRLYTHPRWLPHQWQTQIWCVTTFICFGYAYGWVITTLPLLSSSGKLFQLSDNLGTLQEAKPHHRAQVEAVDPSKMAPTSMANTYNVYHSPTQYAVDVHMDETWTKFLILIG